jgi:pyruvate carboxylase subunit B
MSPSAGAAARSVHITDLTLRDGHQSLFATRMRTEDMIPVAPDMDTVGFWSLEVWGGATFDVMTRFLNEDPWDRVRTLRRLMPHSRLQMLLRGQNLVGYRNYPDDVVKAFVHHAADCGIDVFRVFDALNDERNFITAYAAIREAGKHVQGALSYSVTEPRLGGPVFTIDYFLRKARVIENMGADSLCIKDMAGLLAPRDAHDLVASLKETVTIPVWVHSHFTSGMAYMSLLEAIRAGADGIDTCLAPFGLRTSHPAIEPIVAALSGEPRDTGLSLDRLLALDEYFESIAPKYRDFLDRTKLSIIDTGVLTHQIPGGMFSNMVAQLKEADALNRLNDVYAELPRTRRELGYPPLVTPTSQIVGSQAVLNVLFGRYKMISREVRDYVFGLYGRPPAPIDPEVQALALKGYERGETPITCRAADLLEPELDKARTASAGLARDIGDVLCCALYPTTGSRFLKWKYGIETPPPDTRARSIDDILREDELVARARRGLLVDPAAAPAQAPAAAPASRRRVFNVRVGDDRFTVEVEPEGGPLSVTAASAATAAAPATSAAPVANAPIVATGDAVPSPTDSTVVAPMPGLLIRYLVREGDTVRRGDPMLVLEAMKMENSLPATADGRVRRLTRRAGDAVRRGDMLAVIEQAEGVTRNA